MPRKLKAVRVGDVTLQVWKGLAYRAPSGYSSSQSAAEEAEEYLRQQEYQEPWHDTLRALIPHLRSVRSDQMFWVAKKKSVATEYAERYGGGVDTLDELDGNAVIIGEDGEGGYLVVHDFRDLQR
jgi:hypothetical protein